MRSIETRLAADVGLWCWRGAAQNLELDVEASNVAKTHMVTPESLERLVERRWDYM